MTKYVCVRVVMPVFIFFFIMFGILAGGAYMQDFADWGVPGNEVKAVMFPFGCLVAMVGIFFVSKTASAKEESDAMEGMEELEESDEDTAKANAPEGSTDSPKASPKSYGKGADKYSPKASHSPSFVMSAGLVGYSSEGRRRATSAAVHGPGRRLTTTKSPVKSPVKKQEPDV